MQREVMSLIDSAGLLFERLLFFQKYFDFMDIEPRVSNPANPVPFPAGPLTICFENVSFAYPDGRSALKNINFQLDPGQTIAIVGENGAGKTTLVKLLLRYYDPNNGRITINGIDLRQLDITEWRAQAGAVLQNFGRYSYTITENIVLGSNSPDHESVSQALKDSGLTKLTRELSGQANHRLGKEFGGTELSGGQWQKLATARALYRQADLLILDEPTAALDPRSEHELFQHFARLAKGRTVIMITHRLASVTMTDRVLVLKQGELVEDGSHQALIAKQGEYSDLWSMQAERYVTGSAAS